MKSRGVSLSVSEAGAGAGGAGGDEEGGSWEGARVASAARRKK